MRAPVELEVVIPAYNESARFPDTLRRSVAYLDERPWRSRVVVVDYAPGAGATPRSTLDT